MKHKAYSIRRKLSLSYTIYISIFVLFIGILSNFILQKQFSAYAKNKQQAQITQIVNEIENQYTNTWNVVNIDFIGRHEIDNGYIISVYDVNKQIVWDAREHNNHLCNMVIDEIKANMMSHNPNWSGQYVVKEIPLVSGEQAIGTVEIGYFSPYFYTSEDFNFLTTLNSVFLFSSIIFIIVAIILGAYMAKRLSNPLRKMVISTRNITHGIYELVPIDKSNTDEINQLTHSINALAHTLMNQEQLRKQLTTDVTHELRTPLTTLQTHIEAMIDGVLDTDKLQLNSIHEEIIRLNTIVADLDKLMHYDQETVILNKEYLNISDVIESLLDMFKAAFLNKNVSLNFKGQQANLHFDKDKIHQVFINLISNSLKYTPSGEGVTIEIENKQNEVLVMIKDSGIGIDKKDLPHIFERFYRVDQSRNRKTGGAGIGLSIVQSIINAHNGKIFVESKINEGTKITVSLPKIKEHSF